MKISDLLPKVTDYVIDLLLFSNFGYWETAPGRRVHQPSEPQPHRGASTLPPQRHAQVFQRNLKKVNWWLSATSLHLMETALQWKFTNKCQICFTMGGQFLVHLVYSVAYQLKSAIYKHMAESLYHRVEPKMSIFFFFPSFIYITKLYSLFTF